MIATLFHTQSDSATAVLDLDRRFHEREMVTLDDKNGSYHLLRGSRPKLLLWRRSGFRQLAYQCCFLTADSSRGGGSSVFGAIAAHKLSKGKTMHVIPGVINIVWFGLLIAFFIFNLSVGMGEHLIKR